MTSPLHLANPSHNDPLEPDVVSNRSIGLFQNRKANTACCISIVTVSYIFFALMVASSVDYIQQMMAQGSPEFSKDMIASAVVLGFGTLSGGVSSLFFTHLLYQDCTQQRRDTTDYTSLSTLEERRE